MFKSKKLILESWEKNLLSKMLWEEAYRTENQIAKDMTIDEVYSTKEEANSIYRLREKIINYYYGWL